MNKTILIFAVLTGVLLFAGCKDNRGNDIPTEDKYKTGTDGLTFEFVNKAPPDSVYENTPFTMALVLKNKGAYEISNGFLKLNLEKDYMILNITESENTQFLLKGRSLLNPNGDFQNVQLDAYAKPIDQMSESHTSLVIASVCYDYAAETTQNVCIDADSIGLRPSEKVCKVNDVSLTGQGGPIAITKIEEKMIPVKSDKSEYYDNVMAQYIIHIANKGKGRPVDMGSSPDNSNIAANIKLACNSDLIKEPRYWDKVYLDRIKVSNQAYSRQITGQQPITCTPNPIRLDENGEGEFVCTTSAFNSASDFTTSMFVRLVYGYSESISKSVKITKILTA
jgi:hypothetical protein